MDSPNHETSLYIDSRLNFPPRVVNDRDVQFILDALRDGDRGLVAAINSGLPMSPYMMDALLALRTRHSYAKVRLILEPIISLIVTASHYYNGGRILHESMEKRSRMFRDVDLNRLDDGLRRIYRATNDPGNPYDLIQAVTELDLPDGIYKGYLEKVYTLIKKVIPRGEGTSQLNYTSLETFNYLFKPPKFTSQEAISLYASNLSNITKRSNDPLISLTASKRSKDASDVLNDIMFSLALGNAIVAQHNSLKDLKKIMMMRLNTLCSTLYLVYTQIPELKLTYFEIVRESHSLITASSNEEPSFDIVCSLLLKFTREVMDTGIFANPEYVSHKIFALTSRVHGIQNDTVGYENDLDVEIDTTGPYKLAFHVTNPYIDENIFKCPKNVAANVGDFMLAKKVTQEMMINLTPDEVVFDVFEMDKVKDMVLEATAKFLHITPAQLDHYLDTVNTSADVTAPDQNNLFADTATERPQPTHVRQNFVNLRGAKPYSHTRPHRRRENEETIV